MASHVSRVSEKDLIRLETNRATLFLCMTPIMIFALINSTFWRHLIGYLSICVSLFDSRPSRLAKRPSNRHPVWIIPSYRVLVIEWSLTDPRSSVETFQTPKIFSILQNLMSSPYILDVQPCQVSAAESSVPSQETSVKIFQTPITSYTLRNSTSSSHSPDFHPNCVRVSGRQPFSHAR